MAKASVYVEGPELDAAKNQPRPAEPLTRVKLLTKVDGVGKAGDLAELGKAKALSLVASRRAELAPVLIRFSQSYGQYNGGEVAAFSPKEADLLFKLGVARLESETVKGKKPKPALLDLRTVSDWESAVALVQETSDLETLGRWLDQDPRAAIQKAILDRLEAMD